MMRPGQYLTSRINRTLHRFHNRDGLAKCQANNFDKVYVDTNKKFLYNRIKKNANSAIMVYLHSLRSSDVVPESRSGLSKAKASLPSLASKIVFDNLSNYRRLLVVRDPMIRVLSAFLDRFRDGSKFHETHHRFELSPPGFRDFVKWLADGGLSKNAHWDLQSKLLAFPAEYFTDIVDFKDLNEELPKFFDSVGLAGARFSSHDNLKSGNFHSTNSTDLASRFRIEEVGDKISNLYQEDFRLYAQCRPIQAVSSSEAWKQRLADRENGQI